MPAHAGTPDAIVKRLQEAAVRVMKDPEVASKLRAAGAEPLTSPPQELARQIKEDLSKYIKLAKEIGLTAN